MKSTGDEPMRTMIEELLTEFYYRAKNEKNLYQQIKLGVLLARIRGVPKMVQP